MVSNINDLMYEGLGEKDVLRIFGLEKKDIKVEKEVIKEK